MVQFRFWPRLKRARGKTAPGGPTPQPSIRRQPVQESLDAYPVDPALLSLALTHKSFDESGQNNERLEFLGDAILELIVSEHLYRSFPNYSEGDLTKARVHAVSEPTLAEAARILGLGRRVRMGRGEESSGGRDRPSILSDTFEAVVAAIYLDLGLDAARRFVLGQLTHALHDQVQVRDFKSQLQERTQEARRTTPTYTIVDQSGPAHDRRFVAEVQIGDEIKGRGEGKSKKEAEQAAAKAALEEMFLCQLPPK